MNTRKVLAETYLTLLSPAHISEPGKWYYNPDTGYWQRSETSFPGTRTTRESLPLDSDDPNDYDKTVPVYRGSSFRGTMRRHSAEPMIAALSSDITFALTHILQCGAASPSPDKDPATPSQIAAALRDPYASLFGGGPKVSKGSFSTGIHYPICKDTVARSLVPQESLEQAPFRSVVLTNAIHRARVDDLLRGSPAGEHVRDFEKEVAQWLADSVENKAAKKKQEEEAKAGGKRTEGPGKHGLGGVNYKECMPPGTRLYAKHLFDIALSGPATLGMFLHALAAFANEQSLGGGSSIGWGRFKLDAKFTVDGQTFPGLTFDNSTYAPNRAVALVDQSVAAWEDYVKNLTVDYLETIFCLKKSPKAKGDKTASA